MAKAKKGRGWVWAYSPAKDKRTVPTAEQKAEVVRAANAFIEAELTPRLKPPPKNPRFNYVTGFATKWHGRFFYLIAEYASPGPNAISPTFEQSFARLERTAEGKFHLAYYRHTEEWWTIERDRTLAECFATIRDNGLFAVWV